MSSNISSKKRESNIELLRIISIFFIIIFHYMLHSNYNYTKLTINTLLIKSCYFLGELGVNLFILITGYYLSKSKISYKKIILLIGEVLFYNLISVFISYKLGTITTLTELSYIFPIMTNVYWFITAYLLIYILSPYFNKLISILTKKEYQKFLLTTLLIWCIIPTIYGFFYNSSEELLFYNRLIWLIIMYFVGAYIRIYNIKFLNSKKRSLITSIITFIIMILSIIFIHTFKDAFQRIGTTDIAYFWTPNNILMLILSISIFTLFTKIKIKNNTYINKLASTTLGIYLFHDGFINIYIWKHIFKPNIYIYSNHWYIYTLLSSIIIFIVGFIIDTLRQIIEKYTIKKIINLNIWTNIIKEMKYELKIIIDKII